MLPWGEKVFVYFFFFSLFFRRSQSLFPMLPAVRQRTNVPSPTRPTRQFPELVRERCCSLGLGFLWGWVSAVMFGFGLGSV